MYRDLKPNNVLVNDDGHVQLVDLGGVVDEDGKVIGAQHETNTLLPLFTHQYSVVASATRAQYVEEMDRSDHIDGEVSEEEKRERNRMCNI